MLEEHAHGRVAAMARNHRLRHIRGAEKPRAPDEGTSFGEIVIVLEFERAGVPHFTGDALTRIPVAIAAYVEPGTIGHEMLPAHRDIAAFEKRNRVDGRAERRLAKPSVIGSSFQRDRILFGWLPVRADSPPEHPRTVRQPDTRS